MNEARYLNVDCVLRSNETLSALVSTLEDDVFMLWNESSNDGSFVGFETNLVDTSGPEEDICEFLRIFESHSLGQNLAKCQERVFDIGFESGDFGGPVDVIISPNTVKRICDLGFSIKIRVYPISQP